MNKITKINAKKIRYENQKVVANQSLDEELMGPNFKTTNPQVPNRLLQNQQTVVNTSFQENSGF